MTGLQKSQLSLNGDDIGMMVFQTDVPATPLLPTPKGLYTFDGNAWSAPLLNGTSNGQTLRWDGNKWVATSNLFNQGSSIGIGTLAPNVQLQIHSNNSSSTRIQLTSGQGNSLASDGVLLGISLSNNYAHLIQQENRPLWFGTNAIERMRIDSVGNVGINKTNPSATLDVNGTVKANSIEVTGAIKIGVSGTALNGIIRYTAIIDIPFMINNTEFTCNVPIPNVMPGATVQISPGEALSQLMIEYARVSTAGNVEIKFMNMAIASDPAPMPYYITIIQ